MAPSIVEMARPPNHARTLAAGSLNANHGRTVANRHHYWHTSFATLAFSVWQDPTSRRSRRSILSGVQTCQPSCTAINKRMTATALNTIMTIAVTAVGLGPLLYRTCMRNAFHGLGVWQRFWRDELSSGGWTASFSNVQAPGWT